MLLVPKVTPILHPTIDATYCNKIFDAALQAYSNSIISGDSDDNIDLRPGHDSYNHLPRNRDPNTLGPTYDDIMNVINDNITPLRTYNNELVERIIANKFIPSIYSKTLRINLIFGAITQGIGQPSSWF